MLQLNQADRMETPDRRQSRRLKVNLPVSFEHLGGMKAIGESSTKDISVNGLRMNMDSFFAANASFQVKLRFPEVNRVLESTARIVWSHRISYSDQYQAGLEFQDLNPVFAKWLEEYILIKKMEIHSASNPVPSFSY